MRRKAGGSGDPVERVRFVVLAYAALVPLVFAAGLIVYKWSGSFSAIRKAWSAGAMSARPGIVEFGTGTLLVALERSLNYFLVIAPALAFGILISAAVRSFVQPQLLKRVLGGKGIRGQLKAAMAGAPLMLCSCCVAPIFNTAYERGLRLASSITLMLASPSLNPAALVLTFILLPPKVAFARVGMAILAVTCSGSLVERMFPRACAFPVRLEDAVAENAPPPGLGEGGRCFVRSVGYVVLRTVPALAIGAIGSMILVEFVPPSIWSSGTLRILAVAITATIAVPLALPTFFEIPLALGLISAGGPAGAAVALVFARTGGEPAVAVDAGEDDRLEGRAEPSAAHLDDRRGGRFADRVAGRRRRRRRSGGAGSSSPWRR
jgi:uncharacterized membrane protein YraQ (UPF0718 family)